MTSPVKSRLKDCGHEPMTSDLFGGDLYGGVRLQVLGIEEDVFAAFGHVNPADMVHAVSTAIPGICCPDDVHHVWAVLEPSYPAAPDDEWHLNYGPSITWATPHAFPLTVFKR